MKYIFLSLTVIMAVSINAMEGESHHGLNAANQTTMEDSGVDFNPQQQAIIAWHQITQSDDESFLCTTVAKNIQTRAFTIRTIYYANGREIPRRANPSTVAM